MALQATGPAAWGDPFAPDAAGEIGRGVAKGLEHARQAAIDRAQFNAELDQVRERYWSDYPDGPGVAAVEARYLEMLELKDFWYSTQALVSGADHGLKRAETVDAVTGGPMGGGVHSDAEQALRAMVAKIRESAGLRGFPGPNPPISQLMTLPSRRATDAIAANQEAIDAYIVARNRAEMKLGLHYMRFDAPRDYLVTRLWVDGDADSMAHAKEILEEVEAIAGKERVSAVAEAMRRLPTGKHGEILEPRRLGPYGGYGGGIPARRLLDLHLGHDDPRVYVIGLIRIRRDVSWTEAREIFEEYWIKSLGEDVVLAAAERVRAAEKKPSENYTFGWLPDPIKGTEHPHVALRRLLPHDPYRDFPLGSLDDEDLEKYVLALLKTYGGVEYWNQTPAAYEQFAKTWGEEQIAPAVKKLRSAPRTDEGQFASPEALGVSSANPFEALTEMLEQGVRTPKLYFDWLLRQDDPEAGGVREYQVLCFCFGKERVDEVIQQVRAAHEKGQDLTTLKGAISGFDTPSLAIYDILWATASPEGYFQYLIWRQDSNYRLSHLTAWNEETKTAYDRVNDLDTLAAKVRETMEEEYRRHGREATLNAAGQVARAKKEPFELGAFRIRGTAPRIADREALGLPPGRNALGSAFATFRDLRKVAKQRADGMPIVGETLEINYKGRWRKAKAIDASRHRTRFLLQIGDASQQPFWRDQHWLKANSRPVGAAAQPGNAYPSGTKLTLLIDGKVRDATVTQWLPTHRVWRIEWQGDRRGPKRWKHVNVQWIQDHQALQAERSITYNGMRIAFTGNAKDIAELKEAAQGGNGQACLLLGDLIGQGKIEGGAAQAVTWFERGHKQGHAECTARLTLHLLMGRGVEEDDPRRNDANVRKLAHAAANGHSPLGTYLFAECIAKGIGAQADAVAARPFYQRAARLGDPLAQKWCKDNGVSY